MEIKKILIDTKKQLQADVLDNFILERIAMNIGIEVLKEMKIKKIELGNIKFDRNVGKTFREMEFDSLEEIQNYLIDFCDTALPTFENVNILGDLILSAEKVIFDLYNGKKIKKDNSNITTIKIIDSDALVVEIDGNELGYDKLKAVFDGILAGLNN